MTDAVRVKICGLTRPHDVDAAARAGATYIGLNFFPLSPRALTAQQARPVALAASPGLARVALFVDATDAEIEAVLEAVPIDLLQLHGREAPARVAEVRARVGLPVIKAVGVASEADLPAVEEHGRAADMLLVDAKPAPGAMLPGGNGLAFDWRLIAGRRWPVPWFLAGGLTPANVAEAIRLTGARQVDVSSGVESAPGVKEPDRVRAFVDAARSVSVPAG